MRVGSTTSYPCMLPRRAQSMGERYRCETPSRWKYSTRRRAAAKVKPAFICSRYVAVSSGIAAGMTTACSPGQRRIRRKRNRLDRIAHLSSPTHELILANARDVHRLDLAGKIVECEPDERTGRLTHHRMNGPAQLVRRDLRFRVEVDLARESVDESTTILHAPLFFFF